MSYLYPAGNGWNEHTLETIQTYVNKAGPDWMLFGNPVLFNEIKSSVIRGSALATIFAILFNVVVIYLYFRKISHVLLVILPVTLGFLLTLGIMGYINLPFNFINVGTIALIFGFGVDYGIYVMHAYLKEEKRDIGNALQITGKNVIACSATTIAGCGSLATVQFVGIATIGIVLTIGAISCAIASLLILPAIINLADIWRYKKNERL